MIPATRIIFTNAFTITKLDALIGRAKPFEPN